MGTDQTRALPRRQLADTEPVAQGAGQFEYENRTGKERLRFLLAGQRSNLPVTRVQGYLLAALAMLLLAAYLLVYGGRFHIIDEVSIYAMAENLAKRGALDTNQILWTQWVRTPKEVQGDFGPDGDVYSKKGFGTALVPALLIRLGLLNPGWGLVSIALFANAVITALTAVLLTAYAGRLRARRGTALILGVVFGLATLAFPYTRMLFGEPSSALALLAAAYFLTRADPKRPTGWTLLAALALGFAVWTRLLVVLALLPFVVYLLLRRASLRTLVFFAGIAALVGVGGYLAYDLYRFGNLLSSGYQFGEGESFVTPLLTGLYGLLFSPFRGLFWFAPVLLAAIPGAFLSWRRMRPEAVLAIGLILVYVLPYSGWWMWWGGFAWGPRFLVPIVPFALVLTIPLWESRRAFWPMVALSVVSFLVQILAVTADFTLSETVLENTFGNPARSAAMFDPRWSPIVLQAKHLIEGFWDIAWRRVGPAALPSMVAAAAGAVLAVFVLFAQRKPGLRRVALYSSLVLVALAYVSGLEVHSRYTRETPSDLPIAKALAPVNARAQSTETLVTLTPYDYPAVMNWLRAPLPVIGLAAHAAPLKPQEEQQLVRALRDSSRVRLLARGSMPGNDEVYAERWLTEHAFVYDQQSYEDTRVVSYSVPRGEPRTLTVNEAFAGGISLVQGILQDRDLRAGAPLLIETRWRTAARQSVDYTLFVHLLGPDGRVVAGFDSPPVNGYAPTSTWSVDDEVVDRRALVVPAGAPPGTYSLELGLYDPASGKRMALASGPQPSDRILVSGLQVR